MPRGLNTGIKRAQVSMAQSLDPHRYDEKLKLALNNLERKVGRRNAAFLRSFAGYLLSEGISQGRVLKYLMHLVSVARMLGKDFDKANVKDIRNVVSEIERKDYTDWTKHDYKLAIRRFYRWLRGTEDPPEVSWINLRKHSTTKLPEELLTEEEVEAMASKAMNPRDRAFVLVLYESGVRIGEMLKLRIKHVSFDKYGAILMVNGKTGMRRVRIIASAPALAEWLENHPMRDEGEAPLWIGMWTKNYMKPLDYPAVIKILKTLAKRAGIKKRLYPHLFRHSRASHLANKLTEAQMKEYFGWKQDSDMAAVYVHLSGRDVDAALLKASGILAEEELKTEKFRLVTCQRCGESNSPGSGFCRRCGSPLSLAVALEVDRFKDEAIESLKSTVENFKKQVLTMAHLLAEINPQAAERLGIYYGDDGDGSYSMAVSIPKEYVSSRMALGGLRRKNEAEAT